MKINILKAISIFGWIALAFSIAIPNIVRLVVENLLNISIDDSNPTIGIIGGADGPTAIYVATRNSAPIYFYWIVLLAIAIVPIIVIWRIKKIKKRRSDDIQ